MPEKRALQKVNGGLSIERTRCNEQSSPASYELSLKAKGLLSMMLSLPDDWNYDPVALRKICKEGVDAIEMHCGSWKPARLHRAPPAEAAGPMSDTEYVIYAAPAPAAGKRLGRTTAEPGIRLHQIRKTLYMDKPDKTEAEN